TFLLSFLSVEFIRDLLEGEISGEAHKPLNPYPMISCTTRKCLVQAIRRNNIMAATTPSNP
ncbi:hypothetical protein, partial [Burkholderia multivorans]|uniref:hypothetical protein n=1 Tax=Burkholderia multivorans TaxID=87883 RepID=UPI0019D1BB1E